MIRAVYYPAVVGAAVAFHLAALPYVTVEQLPLVNLAVSAIFIPLIWLSERLLPHHAPWLEGRGDFLADVLQSLLVLPIVARLAEELDRSVVPALRVFPTGTPALVQALCALVVAELLFYWVHRLAHHWLPMWKLHAVHHGAPRVYWGNAGRFHPLDLALTFPIYFAPLFLLGVSPQAFSLFLTMNAVTGLLEHANVDFRAGPLNYVFNTAELHRFHHADGVDDSRCNYGKVLTIWDVVFRTHRYRPDARVGAVGAGEPVPVTFFAQLLHPFRRGAAS